MIDLKFMPLETKDAILRELPLTDSHTYRRYVAKYTTVFCQDCIHDLGGVGSENAETPDCWRCYGLVFNDDSHESFYERK